MNAEQIKNELVKMIAEDKVYDEYAGSTRDEVTVEEMREGILQILEKAGFTDVRQELQREMETVEKNDFTSEDDEE